MTCYELSRFNIVHTTVAQGGDPLSYLFALLLQFLDLQIILPDFRLQCFGSVWCGYETAELLGDVDWFFFPVSYWATSVALV